MLAGAKRSIIVAALDDLPDGNADVPVVLARVRLRRLAPTAIKQDVGGLHAGGGWVLSLAHDRGEVTNSFPGICPTKGPYVRWYCFACQCFIGWVPPPVDAKAFGLKHLGFWFLVQRYLTGSLGLNQYNAAHPDLVD